MAGETNTAPAVDGDYASAAYNIILSPLSVVAGDDICLNLIHTKQYANNSYLHQLATQVT